MTGNDPNERTWVRLTDLQWAVIFRTVQRAGLPLACEAAEEMAEQVRTAQRLRRERERQ